MSRSSAAVLFNAKGREISLFQEILATLCVEDEHELEHEQVIWAWAMTLEMAVVAPCL